MCFLDMIFPQCMITEHVWHWCTSLSLLFIYINASLEFASFFNFSIEISLGPQYHFSHHTDGRKAFHPRGLDCTQLLILGWTRCGIYISIFSPVTSPYKNYKIYIFSNCHWSQYLNVVNKNPLVICLFYCIWGLDIYHV